MLPNMNLSQARSNTVEAGGYIVKVISTNIDTTYNRLQLEVDITEGPNKGHFTRLYDNYGFWGLTINLYMDEKSRWKFARTIEAFRQSNVDFEWDDDGENDEKKLVGMYIGVVTQKRHYYGNDGREKTKLLVYKTVPVEDIREGNYEVPEDSYSKDYNKYNSPASAGVVDTTIPDGFAENIDETPF